MKINDIVNEAAPPAPQGPSGNYNNMSPAELQAEIDRLEVDDEGLDPVVVVPVLQGLKRLLMLKKGVDLLKPGKQKKPEKPSKTKSDPTRGKKPDDWFGGTDDDYYEPNPNAGPDAANWFRKTQGGTPLK